MALAQQEVSQGDNSRIGLPFGKQTPIRSMYAIYGNIYHQYTPNVRIYTIHGSYGLLGFQSKQLRLGGSSDPSNFVWYTEYNPAGISFSRDDSVLQMACRLQHGILNLTFSREGRLNWNKEGHELLPSSKCVVTLSLSVPIEHCSRKSSLCKSYMIDASTKHKSHFHRNFIFL